MFASSSGEGGPRWSFATRFAFRFLFCFFLLHLSVPLPFMLLQVRVGAAIQKFWAAIVPRVALSAFGINVTATARGGSGDTMWDWMLLFTIVLLSLTIAIVWSLIDRNRLAYPKLHVFLRVYLRFALALAMFAYGIAKVIPMQFQPPPLDRLTERFGDASPMGLLWTFMGASMPYTIFAGIGELLGGLLLTMRRTAVLGALISAAVLANIVMLNFSYDVPVKIYSSVLLLAALCIAAPDAQRLMHALVLNRAVDAPVLRPAVGPPWLQNVTRVVRTALVVWFVVTSVQQTLRMRDRYIRRDDLAPLHGIWRVDAQAIDGVVRPPLLTDSARWRRVIFTGNRIMSVEWMTDHRERFTVTHDNAGFMLRKLDDLDWYAYFKKQQPDRDTLVLAAEIDGHNFTATLHRMPMPRFLLTTRGFHWINEVPFNR